MKKLFYFCTIMIAINVLFVFNINFMLNVNASSLIEVNYSADFSNGLPKGWTSYEYADPTHTTISNTEDGLAINHANTAIDYKLYYGSLIDFGEDVQNLSDFTFEMDFRYTSYLNDTRWIGLLYHTQYDDNNKLSGYGMNYRPIGRSAHVTLSAAPNFVDSDVTNTSVKMTDKETYHTMKIVCEGTSVTHYIDSEKVHEFDLKEYSSGLLEVQTYGGFGLIVNQCTVEIKRLNIFGTRVTPSVKMDNSLAQLYNPNCDLVNDFSVNTRINSVEELVKIKESEAKPHTAILSINKEMKLVDEENNSLDIELATAYNHYLKGNVMPAIKIEDEETALKFIEYYNSSFKMLDIFVLSTKPEIVKKIRTELTNIRGIIDYSKENLSLEDLGQIVLTTNKSFANTIILNSETATYEAIRYVQARFKTVWVDNLGFSKLNVVSQIANGAYGIISPEYDKVYESLEVFEGTDGKNINRAPYNVAHRGLCKTSYENSLEGFVEAYEKGATHLEIDVHLSKDGKIVVMHDDSINRTTNGTGGIANMTYEEISQYKITKNYSGKVMGEGVKIPLLDDILKEFKGKDVVYVVEIKTTNTAIAKVLNDLLDELGVKDQTVVISFQHSQIKQMMIDCPEIPTASLSSFTYAGLASGLATTTSLNCGIDTTFSNGTKEFTRATALRGYSSWYWTYDTADAAYKGLNNGAQGITNNEPDLFAEYGIKPEFNKEYLVVDPDNYSKDRAVNVETYKGVGTEKFLATPIYVEIDGNQAYVIYKCTFTYGQLYYNIYSDVIRLVNKDEYISLDRMNEFLSKNPTELTESDVNYIKTFEEKALLLSESEQEQLDLGKIDELIKAYNENLNNNNNDNSDDNIDNNNDKDNNFIWILIPSILGVCTLCAAGIIIYKKKKR